MHVRKPSRIHPYCQGPTQLCLAQGCLHQLALCAVGTVAGSMGIAKRLAQDPAEAAGPQLKLLP